MRLEHPLRHARTAAIAAAIVASSVSAFGQSGQSRLTEIAKSAATGLALQPGETLRAISIDEAVKLGLEQNLGIQIQRYDPQIQDTAIAQARSFWAPQFSTTLTRASNEQPVVNIFSGNQPSTSSGQFFSGLTLAETLPWGANYSANWNNSRFTTNDPANTFNPRLHEPGGQTVLGKRYEQEDAEQGRAVLRDLAAHPATATHVATKLARHFVADEPPPPLVEQMAKTFRDTEGDLKQVAITMVSSDDAWRGSPSKLKRPSEWGWGPIRH